LYRSQKWAQMTFTKKAEIGFAVVGNNQMMINSCIDKIFNLADRTGLAEIVDTEMEIINL